MNYIRFPGYGDVETWPPCYGHPLDPRTPEPNRSEDEDEDDEDEMEPDDETLEASYEQARNEQRSMSNGNFTG